MKKVFPIHSSRNEKYLYSSIPFNFTSVYSILLNSLACSYSDSFSWFSSSFSSSSSSSSCSSSSSASSAFSYSFFATSISSSSSSSYCNFRGSWLIWSLLLSCCFGYSSSFSIASGYKSLGALSAAGKIWRSSSSALSPASTATGSPTQSASALPSVSAPSVFRRCRLGCDGGGLVSLSSAKRSMRLHESLPSAEWSFNSEEVTYVKIIPHLFLPASLQRNGDEMANAGLAKQNITISSSTMDVTSFGDIFRHCAPYIASHRGSTMVFHIPSHYIDGSAAKRVLFENIMDEIAILHLLGVKIVLVVGVRETVDSRLLTLGKKASYHHGIRVTDAETLSIIKEESGKARFEVESLLARGFKGITNSKQVGINVVSSNMFYSAKPFGIRDGVDYQFTGEVRRIDSENIRRRLDNGDIICLTSLGYSMSGEIFHIPSETLGAECAIALQATKILYITEGEGIIDIAKNSPIQSLRLSQAKNLLAQWNIQPSTYNYIEKQVDMPASIGVEGQSTAGKIFQNMSDDMQDFLPIYVDTTPSSYGVASSGGFAPLQAGPQQRGDAVTTPSPPPSPTQITSFVRMIARSVYALTGGVKRAHLVPPTPGALVSELFTRDGAGLLIARDTYEGVRQAQEEDLRSMLEIIRPLEQEGILVHRTAEQILAELSHYYVMTRDGSVVALGKLTQYSPTHGEIACLAVNPNYRKHGRGEIMLSYLERRAMTMGMKFVFVLSTRTMQWFEERGFRSTDPTELPANRAYDKTRGSKVYMKLLGSSRDIDAEELLWNLT